MQSKDHCTYGCTTLYEFSICCVECNTESELFCETLAEGVMFEVDLWNIDSLSSTIFGSIFNIVPQQDSFPTPVPSGKAIFALQKHRKVSSSVDGCIHL